MKLKHLLLPITAAISIGSLSVLAENQAPSGHAAPHWTYEGAEGAEKWGKLDPSFSLCETGPAQSPVDLKETISADLPDITFAYGLFSPKVVNNGHTIQANVPAGHGIKVGKDEYQLLQFHFHTPSEYHIEGKPYPLEVHFVHKNIAGQLAVVGVMFAEGEANAELEKIWKSMPANAGEEKSTAEMIDISKLLPKDHRYYRFMGSLTTPPCSEGVNWHSIIQPITASKEQLDAFRKLFAMNARPLQPINNRLIVRDEK